MNNANKPKKLRKHKCRHCGKLYQRNPCAKGRQKYCSDPACRKESKRVSQAKWCSKNPKYFKNGASTERSRAWRKKKRSATSESEHMHQKKETNNTYHSGNKDVTSESHLVAPCVVQQDMMRLNLHDNAFMVGLLCMMTGILQQDEIGPAYQKVLSLGQEALGASP